MQRQKRTRDSFLTPEVMAKIASGQFMDAATGAAFIEALEREGQHSAAGLALSQAVSRILPLEDSESPNPQLDLF